MSLFLSDYVISTSSWQAFERLTARLLVERGFTYVSVVGQSGDGGADVLAIHPSGKRWLLQVKRRAVPVSTDVLDETIRASQFYQADVPVVVSKAGFTGDLLKRADQLREEGIAHVQLWDRYYLVNQARALSNDPIVVRKGSEYRLRDYQESAVQDIVGEWDLDTSSSALVVLATGLGKTFVAGEALRRLFLLKRDIKALVLAHTNDLVYQLERSFWRFLGSRQSTLVVNGNEKPSDWNDLRKHDVVFATRDVIAAAVRAGTSLPAFDITIIDECHHLGAYTYESVLDSLGVGSGEGPFAIGMTATPWRPDGTSLYRRFRVPTVNMDMIDGLRAGYLANVDYRMYTDNVDWDRIRKLKGGRFTPRAINRTLFVREWDNAVIRRLQEAWNELGGKARGLVFCGNVKHAEWMAHGINALGFTSAKPIAARSSDGRVLSPAERNKLLWDFADGRIGILCAVDILNEGIDVPSINLVVFQRVTHSRRIFVQQLGRGLRISPGKDRVIVLDFVSDIRRFAAGLSLKTALSTALSTPGKPVRQNIGHKISFRRANREDTDGPSFLREWLGDVEEIEESGDDVSVLRYPPLDTVPRM